MVQLTLSILKIVTVIIFSYLAFVYSASFAFQDFDDALQEEEPVSQFKQDVKTLNDSLYSYTVAQRNIKLHKQLKKLQSLKNDYPEAYKDLQDVEIKLYLSLMYGVHIAGGHFDSLDHYYPKLKLDQSSPELASRANSIMAYGKRLNYDFKAFLYYTDKSLEALSEQEGEEARFRRIRTLIDVANFYIDYSSFYNAENTIN